MIKSMSQILNHPPGGILANELYKRGSGISGSQPHLVSYDEMDIGEIVERYIKRLEKKLKEFDKEEK